MDGSYPKGIHPAVSGYQIIRIGIEAHSCPDQIGIFKVRVRACNEQRVRQN